MADPRMTVDFTDIDAELMTFTTDGSIVFDKTKVRGSAQAGLAVKMVGQKQVGLCVDADPVIGAVDHVEATGMAVVQTGGVATFKGGLSATLTPGSKIVGALGASSAAGYIRSVAAATLAEVAVADGEILDATDPTAVQVLLD